MEKKTATERVLGQNGLFAQTYGKEPQDEPNAEASKPKARSTRAFLDSLKQNSDSPDQWK